MERFKWQGDTTNLDGLAGSGLESINNKSRRWSMAITGGITVEFYVGKTVCQCDAVPIFCSHGQPARGLQPIRVRALAKLQSADRPSGNDDESL